MCIKSSIHPGRAFLAILVCLPLLGAACATPVSVKRVDARQVHRELTRDVLSAERPSGPTRNVLDEQNLFERFQPDSPADAPDPFDPRLRQAANLYNRALTAGFASADGSRVELRGGEFGLPCGTLDFPFDEASLGWAGRRLSNFVPVAELEVRGLQTRYRRSGIGAPIAASAVPIEGQASADDLLASDAKVPVTAVPRLDDVRPHLASGRLQASLEMHVATRGSAGVLTMGGRPGPAWTLPRPEHRKRWDPTRRLAVPEGRASLLAPSVIML